MIEFDAMVDVPATVRYHQDVIEQIIQSVEEGVYCALLGPRLCGKTLLLRYIESDLARLLGWTCVYLNLLDIRATTQQAFFADLTRQAALRVVALCIKYVTIMDSQPGQLHLLPVSREALQICPAGKWIPKVCNSFMAQVDQMPGHLLAAIRVIMVNGITVIFRRLVVDHHDWDVIGTELLTLL